MSVATRHNLRGTPNDQLFAWDGGSGEGGTLDVQQHIQLTIRRNPADIDAILLCPDKVDQNVWVYEHVRQLVLELSWLVVSLAEECSSESCPVMSATSEWIFRCAAHKTPMECSAMDYMLHALDHSSSFLTSCKSFPSRIAVSSQASAGLPNLVRRLFRLFAHGYHHHAARFAAFEARTHLCARAAQLALRYNLMTEAMLLVPKDAYAVPQPIAL